MSVFFNAREIVQFAIRIEENGEKFYRYAVGMAKNDVLKEIFNYLADEENEHKRTFVDLVSKMEKYEPVESYPNEYFEYLTGITYIPRLTKDEFLLWFNDNPGYPQYHPPSKWAGVDCSGFIQRAGKHHKIFINNNGKFNPG